MSKDYKNSGKRKTSKRKPVPGWIWLATGLSVGLLIALLVFLTKQPVPKDQQVAHLKLPEQHTQKVSPKKPAHTASKTASKGDSATKKKDGVKFEFYTLLPESEVVVPEKELNSRTAPPPGKTIKPTAGGTYILQAGSFRNEDEARTLKGELALLGVVADIQNVTINGDTWHRVRIGPFASVDDVNKVRERLRRNNINTIPLRIKG